MTSITKKRGTPSMEAVPPNASHATPRPTLSLVRPTAIDYAAMSLRFMRLGSLVMALCCLALMMNPVPMGIIGVAQLDLRLLPQIADMGQRRIVLAGVGVGLFLADMFQRVPRPIRWTYLTSLSGFGVGAMLATLYTLQGKVSAIGLALYGGAFVLSLALMIAIIQRKDPLKYLAWVEGNLMRVVSVIFAVLAFGLWTQTDSALTMFIQTRYGWLFLGLIIVLLVWGSAQLRHNHLAAWDSFRRVIVIFLFTGMMLFFLTYDPSASILSAALSVYLLGLIVLTVWFQAQGPQAQENAR